MTQDSVSRVGTRWIRSAGRCLAFATGVAAASYGTYVTLAWHGYGHARKPGVDEDDFLLDRFMPEYEVVERHHVSVAAPAGITLAAAADMDLERSAIVRAIFKGREFILGSEPDSLSRPRALLAQMKSLGWGVLAQIPDRDIVVGAVTQPWKANPVFQSIPPGEFAAFNEPLYVKIVWTLRADPISSHRSIFRTETRVATTDPVARSKFRRYWAFLSPGIILIRHLSLALVKTEAERRARGHVVSIIELHKGSTGKLVTKSQ